MIELNLLPDVKKEFLHTQKTRNRVISGAIMVSMIAVGLVALFAVTVYIGQNSFRARLESDITNNHKTLSSKQEINKYLTVQGQLAALKDIGGSQSSFSRLYDYLAQLNPQPPNNVYLYTLDLSKDDALITIEGTAANFEVVNNFQSTLLEAKLAYTVQEDGKDVTKEEKLFSKVEPLTAAITTASGQAVTVFSFNLTYNEIAFQRATRDPRVVVPKLVTSDADQNAPQELFTAPPETKPEEKPNGNQ